MVTNMTLVMQVNDIRKIFTAQVLNYISSKLGKSVTNREENYCKENALICTVKEVSVNSDSEK